MNIPAVAFIEMAADALKELSPDVLTAQRKEAESLGDGRAVKMGATGITEDFLVGYELGLQTMRMLLMGLPPGADPRKL